MTRAVNNRPNPKHVASFILPPDLNQRLGRVAKAQGLSRSFIARAIFAGWLDLAGADLLKEITDLRRKLVSMQVEELRRLGHGRDIELLFHEGYCMPDWNLASGFDTEARGLVREIANLGVEVERALDELDLRERPN